MAQISQRDEGMRRVANRHETKFGAEMEQKLNFACFIQARVTSEVT